MFIRDGFTSINRLPEKSSEYGLMPVMAVKIVKKIKNKKTAILFSFDLKNTIHLFQCIFWYQLCVLEHLCC